MALWIPTALSLVVGVRWLLGEAHSIFGDEAFHLSNLFDGVSGARAPWPDSLTNLYFFNFAYPPVFYLLSAAFVLPAADPVFAGRVYAQLLTLLACIMLYVVVRSQAGRMAGAASVATLLGTPSFVDPSRHYLLETLITVELLLLLYLLGQYYRTRRPRVLLSIAMVVSIGLLTKFNFVFYAVPLFLVPSSIEARRALQGRESLAAIIIKAGILIGIPLLFAGPWYLSRAAGATGMLATLYEAGTLKAGLTFELFTVLVVSSLSSNYSILVQALAALSAGLFLAHLIRGRRPGGVLGGADTNEDVIVASAFVGAIVVPIILALLGISGTLRWHIEASFLFIATFSVLGRLVSPVLRYGLLGLALVAALLQLVAVSITPLPVPSFLRVPQPDLTPLPSTIEIGSEKIARDIGNYERLVGGTKPGDFTSFLYHEHGGPHFGSVEWYLRQQGVPLRSRVAAFNDRAIDIENIVGAKYLVDAIDGHATEWQDPETQRYRALAARLPASFRDLLIEVSDVQGRFGRFKVWYVPRERVTEEMVLAIIESGRAAETVKAFGVIWDAQRIVWRARFEPVAGNESLRREIDTLMAALPASEPHLSTINRDRLREYLANIDRVRSEINKAAKAFEEHRGASSN